MFCGSTYSPNNCNNKNFNAFISCHVRVIKLLSPNISTLLKIAADRLPYSITERPIIVTKCENLANDYAQHAMSAKHICAVTTAQMRPLRGCHTEDTIFFSNRMLVFAKFAHLVTIISRPGGL